jgi:hypothetical protein
MRFFLLGPRLLGLRTGISFGARDFRRAKAPSGTGRNMTGGFVYVLANELGQHKIGSAIDPISRRATLQTGSAQALSFAYIGVAPEGAYTAIERAAHDLLDARRLSGGGSEWFAVPASIAIGAVYEVSQRHGWPIQQVLPEHVPEIIRLANLPDPGVPTQFRWRRVQMAFLYAALGAFAFTLFLIWLGQP